MGIFDFLFERKKSENKEPLEIILNAQDINVAKQNLEMIGDQLDLYRIIRKAKIYGIKQLAADKWKKPRELFIKLSTTRDSNPEDIKKIRIFLISKLDRKDVSFAKRFEEDPFFENLLEERRLKLKNKELEEAKEKLKEMMKEFPPILYTSAKPVLSCNKCYMDSPINSLSVKQKCAYCDNVTRINKNYILDDFFHDDLVEEDNYEEPHYFFYKQYRRNNIKCYNCNNVLEEADKVDHGNHEIICPKCKAVTFGYNVPDWMQKEDIFTHQSNGHKYQERLQYKATMAFSAEKPLNQGGEKKEIAKIKVEPVAFECKNCSAALEINEETPRILDCKYCGTDQYLPDDLWNRFHAVATAKNIWIKLERITPKFLKN